MKTKKFKIWVAVDADGAVFAYANVKPAYGNTGYWWDDKCQFMALGFDKELKAGEDVIKEIEIEFPLKEDSNEKDK